MDVFSPALPEHLPPQSLPDSNPFSMSDTDAPPSPLPKLVVSPRHETGNRSPFHGRPQYSPTHSIASTVTLTGMAGALMSGEEFCTGGFYFNNANQGQPAAVPISPHVNVPTASNLEYRAVPPPLPPRRKERTESCADMAQKRQAPDAPTVSPLTFIYFLKY